MAAIYGNKYVGSGGGATHISLESGVLSDLSKYSLNNNSPIIIIEFNKVF